MSQDISQAMTREFTRDDYAACMNTDFVVEFAPELKVTMKLIEVTKIRERNRQESFSLLLAAPEDAPFAQQIFKVQNEKLGETELFLVPVGKDDRGMLYESVFNRLLPRKEEEE